MGARQRSADPSLASLNSGTPADPGRPGFSGPAGSSSRVTTRSRHGRSGREDRLAMGSMVDCRVGTALLFSLGPRPHVADVMAASRQDRSHRGDCGPVRGHLHCCRNCASIDSNDGIIGRGGQPEGVTFTRVPSCSISESDITFEAGPVTNSGAVTNSKSTAGSKPGRRPSCANCRKRH